MPKTLYLCYFGLREPLVQTQVLPYLREISKDNVDVSILTFEPNLKQKWTENEIESERAKLAAEGIDWHFLAYHKWPSVPATLYDILSGTLFVRQFIKTQKPDIIHGRVHLPTLMGAMARKISRHKPKLLFDIRGFFPEEYTDAGIWPENGLLYRSVKRIEKWLFKEADGFVVLTEKARKILFEDGENANSKIKGLKLNGRPVEVIPCCVDLSRFDNHASRNAVRKRLDITDRFVTAYVGSFGGWYLTEQMIDFFEAAREFHADAFAMVLTQRDKDKVAERLRQRGFSNNDFLVETVEPSQIPGYLIGADSALSFIKACYSKLSSSPTKIAEYLACGVPIVANRGVGDVDDLIERNQVGTIVNEFTREEYLRALKAITDLGDISNKCIETARREFDLGTVGGGRYRVVYKKVLHGAVSPEV